MKELKKINEFEYEVPVSGDMRVAGRIFSSENLVGNIDEKAIKQVRDVASLPGILRASFAMPDIHQGYGFSIGGVAAFDLDKGVICPGGVGYDINCSVRLLKTNLREGDLKGREDEILKGLSGVVPSGAKSGGGVELSNEELDGVLKGGAQWAVEAGYGNKEDWKHVEDEGKLEGADVEAVSDKAKGRGISQLGTLGAGNHFLDLLVVDEVFDEGIAKVFGLEKGQVVIMIHCGSRGLGHQVATDYIEEMPKGEEKGRLVSAPIKSEVGKRYFGAMSAAANFAFANKQVISYLVGEEMKKFFEGFEMEVVYEVCHNIAKIERHNVEGEKKDILVMRKGATRAFGAGSEEVCEDYRKVGQPVMLPGSMGTSSYVLVGGGENRAWGSSAHGAGRLLSRSEAGRSLSFDEAVLDMRKREIFVRSGKKGMVEESPFSYKDVDEVVRVCDEAGLGKRVAGLRPIMVLIG
jgi:tRNA-splicing ligase RtcB (3'-phosphate/5'-hydroxy nucleic acid ligase)